MFELSELFGRFMPSTWSKRGVVGDYFDADVIEAERPRRRAGTSATTLLCAAGTFLAVGGMSQAVHAENLAVPGYSQARSQASTGTPAEYERVSRAHLQNVVEFVRGAPRIYRDIAEPDPSF